MIDAITQERIVIYNEAINSPYIMVAHAQLDQVTDILKAHAVPHWVNEDVISLDGEPAVAVINLGRLANVAEVQNLLDEL